MTSFFVFLFVFTDPNKNVREMESPLGEMSYKAPKSDYLEWKGEADCTFQGAGFGPTLVYALVTMKKS